jgi:hypothetical protein
VTAVPPEAVTAAKISDNKYNRDRVMPNISDARLRNFLEAAAPRIRAAAAEEYREVAEQHYRRAERLRKDYIKLTDEVITGLTTPEHVMTAFAGLPECRCRLPLGGGDASGAFITHALAVSRQAVAAERAQVYAEIRQLAIDKRAEYRTPPCTNPGCPKVSGEHVHKLPFADLIGGGGDG